MGGPTDRLSADDLQRVSTARPEPVDREVSVEARDAMDAAPVHHGEARPVDEREPLVGVRLADREGPFEIGRPDRLDGDRARADRAPCRRRDSAASLEGRAEVVAFVPGDVGPWARAEVDERGRVRGRGGGAEIAADQPPDVLRERDFELPRAVARL